MTTSEPRFEWDPSKELSNFHKHGVWFADATYVFMDVRAIVKEDHELSEERYVMIGMDGVARVLVVAFTWRGDLVRIISARKANRLEERLYDRGER